MKAIRQTILILMATSIISCTKEDGPVTNDNNIGVLTDAVIVLNEGAFLGNNASLSMVTKSGVKSDNVYQKVNGAALGDVLQSAMETAQDYFLVVNNSGYVVQVGKTDLKNKKTISGFRSPRYMLNIGSGKALVSNFVYDTVDVPNEINIVNMSSGDIIGEISVTNWCEQMVLLGEKIYVANTGSDNVLIYDKKSLEKIGEFSTPPQPSDLEVDKSGKIWILCTGGFQTKQAAICMYDPQLKTLTKTLRFDNDFAFPSRLKIDEKKENLYYIEGGVFRLNINDNELPMAPVIASSTVVPYGLGIEPGTDLIYVTDALDFSSNGRVHVFSSSGAEIGSFTAGVVPANFLFQ